MQFIEANPRIYKGDPDFLIHTLALLAYADLAEAERILEMSENTDDAGLSRRIRETALSAIAYNFSPEWAMALARDLGKSEVQVGLCWIHANKKSFDDWFNKAKGEERAIGLAASAEYFQSKAPRKAAQYLAELGKVLDSMPMDAEMRTRLVEKLNQRGQ